MTIRIIDTILAREILAVDNSTNSKLVAEDHVVRSHAGIKYSNAYTRAVQTAGNAGIITDRISAGRQRDMAKRPDLSVQRNAADFIERSQLLDNTDGQFDHVGHDFSKALLNVNAVAAEQSGKRGTSRPVELKNHLRHFFVVSLRVLGILFRIL